MIDIAAERKWIAEQRAALTGALKPSPDGHPHWRIMTISHDPGPDALTRYTAALDELEAVRDKAAM